MNLVLPIMEKVALLILNNGSILNIDEVCHCNFGKSKYKLGSTINIGPMGLIEFVNF